MAMVEVHKNKVYVSFKSTVPNHSLSLGAAAVLLAASRRKKQLFNN